MTKEIAQLQTIFENLAGEPLSDFESLMSKITTKSYQTGAVIFNQGQLIPNIYFLHQGIVRLEYITSKGRNFTKAILEENAFIASLSALENAPASFSAITLETCHISIFNYTNIINQMQSNLLWERIVRKMMQSIAKAKETREFELLTLSASQRWNKLREQRPDLISRVAQNELAALIGITPVALSRLKRRDNTN